MISKGVIDQGVKQRFLEKVNEYSFLDPGYQCTEINDNMSFIARNSGLNGYLRSSYYLENQDNLSPPTNYLGLVLWIKSMPIGLASGYQSADGARVLIDYIEGRSGITPAESYYLVEAFTKIFEEYASIINASYLHLLTLDNAVLKYRHERFGFTWDFPIAGCNCPTKLLST